MPALLLTAALFLAWWLLGLALLAAVGADTRCAHVALTAPALGVCAVMLPAFVLSQLGVPAADSSTPIVIVLAVAAAVVLVLRRPRLPLVLVAMGVICVGGLLVIGAPMFEFGFRWLGNANDDMANYVLGATRLFHDGVRAPLDVSGLVQGLDYPTAMERLHAAGARPGGEMVMAVVRGITGRPVYEIFMPVILAAQLCVACAVGALALQAARRPWAAPLAAALILVSPMATFGVLQQLLGQVFGLLMAVSLAALLMRPELHEASGARVRDVVPIGVLAGALVLAYPELLGVTGISYILYLGVLRLRRRIDVRSLPRLWISVLALAMVLLGPYLIDAVGFLSKQTNAGFQASERSVSLFAYMLVPSALPGAIGLQILPPPFMSPRLDLSIVLAAVLLAAALIIGFAGAWRARAAAIVVVVEGALAALLALNGADFALFKLTMYAAPFLAAAVAAWVASGGRRRLALGAGPLVIFALAALSTQHAYVQRSRDPFELRNASAKTQLPVFRRAVAHAHGRTIVSAAENIFLQKLEGASAAGHRLLFISRDPFTRLVEAYDPSPEIKRARVVPSWRDRAFDLRAPAAPASDPFQDNVSASAHLQAGDCDVALSSGTQVPFNRRQLPEGSPDLVVRRCGTPRNFLAFTLSQLGSHFYLGTTGKRRFISYYQLEADPYRPHQTFSVFGRYALFRVLGPSPRMHLCLDLTSGLLGDASNRVPPAAVVGASRQPLRLSGRGSARACSPTLRPQVIAGVPYVLLDMGVDGSLLRAPRSGLQGLWNRDVPLDPRYTVTRVRDVSLVDDAEYSALRPPAAVRSFPGDLIDPRLEYSGIYDDGWIGESGFMVLSGRAGDRLRVEGLAAQTTGNASPGPLTVLVDGRVVARRALAVGPFRIDVPVARGGRRRTVELRFVRAGPQPPPDRRPVSAHLSFVGFVPGARR